MHSLKRGLSGAVMSMALLAGSLAISEPAFANVTQNKCQNNVCMQIVRNSSSGKTVVSAYVYMPGSPIGTTASVRYVGYGRNGSPKGPQKSQTVHCDPLCAYKWTINYTYASGDWIYGTVIVSGVVEGTPVYSF